ncbi:peptide-N-glycosidase F-related protein [Flavobacteriales bacterium]|nr:peptide-N-glycosidase F-related protein [Flavobacteriales bacterium]
MKLVLLSLFTITFSISILAGDTTTVRIHDHTDMTWYGDYDEWGELPDTTKKYRKVYLHYTMGCATGGCSDWDYTSQIFVRHRTGQLDSSFNEIIENYELARVITPYGSGLANSWEFTHTFDVTDFIQVLRDSVEIRCHYSGWSSGFSATLDFEFIEGTPPRDVMKIENVYSGSYNYINSSDFESTKLPMKYVQALPFNGGGKLRMTTTGHGFDNNQSAAEFKPINYYVKHNGMTLYTQSNWDANCGENPIYPQGGTWIYDRANWCPGTRAQTFEHEILSTVSFAGDSLDLDIDFQAYSWSGTQTPSYIIECQFVQYKNPNFTNSVEIIDIIKPSLKDEHSRKNPVCGKPLIKIRNYGSTPLTQLEIEYKVLGGTINTYSWTGNLAFLETEEVELPSLNSWSGSDNIFEVKLKNPNGQPDDYNENNSMKSEFETVPEYPETFAVWLGTNAGVINSLSQESETSWDIYDESGSPIYTSGSLYANIQYRDTLTFSSGCYTFVVEDVDEDGLDFWANSDGSGMVRFREIGATWLAIFNADFGTNIVHQFRIGGTQSASTSPDSDNWDIFPNPTKDNILIKGIADNKTEILIIDNLGKRVFSVNLNKAEAISKTIDISHLRNGAYSVQIINSDNKIIKKIVKQ